MSGLPVTPPSNVLIMQRHHQLLIKGSSMDRLTSVIQGSTPPECADFPFSKLERASCRIHLTKESSDRQRTAVIQRASDTEIALHPHRPHRAACMWLSKGFMHGVEASSTRTRWLNRAAVVRSPPPQCPSSAWPASAFPEMQRRVDPTRNCRRRGREPAHAALSRRPAGDLSSDVDKLYF